MNIAKLAPMLGALILAACYNQPSPGPTVSVAPAKVGPAQGIDLPTDASDVLNELKDSRVDFVARYYRDPSSHWPPLSPGEARRLAALGVKIVAVWESHSRNPWYFSYYSGYGDAVTAYRQAKAVGQPDASAIYFAIDFDARGASFEPVVEYFRGIAAGLARASGGAAEYRVGVYGSGAVCDAVKRAGLAQYSWLSNSTAWTGSLGYDDWNIRQGGPRAELSFNHDSDEAKDEYGGFRLAGHGAAADDGAAVTAARTRGERQWLATALPPSL